MSVNITIPALRRPKAITNVNLKKTVLNEIENIILTLKDNKSLVITSDAYHGIIMGREMFKCVFCNAEVQLDFKIKESHKNSSKHKNVLGNYPHIEEYGENLIRKLDQDNYYCTLCNVIVTLPFVRRHFSTEAHLQELHKAATRASIYKPLN